MRFLRPLAGLTAQPPKSLALFAGAFHPPTIAHWELAEAARAFADAVVWVLPQRFPHKGWDGVALEQRAELLLQATAHAPETHAVAVVEQNLFFEMAQELQDYTGVGTVHLIAGGDAAQRLLDWDYGFTPEEKLHYLREGLQRFPLLSARRLASAEAANWKAPEELQALIHWLDLAPEYAAISSSLVRECIARGEHWRHLVPQPIRDLVAQLYASKRSSKR